MKHQDEENKSSNLGRLFEYCLLQINEETTGLQKRRKLSRETYESIKKKDANIIDTLKKRRGRKKFILIDAQVKDRLSQRETWQLEAYKSKQTDQTQEKRKFKGKTLILGGAAGKADTAANSNSKRKITPLREYTDN